MKFLACQMKCMHLGEKTGHQPTQRDKPSNLGEKTEDMPTQRDKPSNLGEKQRTCQLNETCPPIWVCEVDNR
ncbi:hypothetical protein TNCV_289071 [Trichonephila clavipes]|nr:hypothetical protein TNCV_289071 [Trichonephila clavipes]